MRLKEKHWQLKVAAPLEEVWNFFAHPDNLAHMTPEGVGFKMLNSQNGQAIYPGMIIQHEVRPILNIPMYWVTEITHVKKHHFFIDEQRIGPYHIWHHEHRFESYGEHTTIVDRLNYRVGWGPLGSIANTLFVERMVDDIFEHRTRSMEEMFGAA